MRTHTTEHSSATKDEPLVDVDAARGEKRNKSERNTPPGTSLPRAMLTEQTDTERWGWAWAEQREGQRPRASGHRTESGGAVLGDQRQGCTGHAGAAETVEPTSPRHENICG